jgi:malate/lactate dehydrogenase
MTPQSCPRWDKCSVSICPLDPDWNKRVLMRDDSTCYYLTESVKQGAAAIFRSRGLGELYAVIAEATPAICSRHRRIETALNRAKESGSRMNREFRLESEHG